MVINQIYVDCILSGKLENNPPVSRHGHCPLTLACAFQGVKPESRQIHVFRLGAAIEHGQDLGDTAGVLGVYTAMIPCPKKPLKALVTKTQDHL